MSETEAVAPSASNVARGSGRSGPRASLACLNCRQRKIKCRMTDPNDAVCQSCRSLNLPCIVNKDGDRRKAGSRQHVAALQERLDYLESFIASGQHRNTSPPPSDRSAEPRSGLLPSMPAPDVGFQPSSHTSMRQRQPRDTRGVLNDSFYFGDGPVSHSSHAAPPPLIGSKPTAQFHDGSGITPQTDLGRTTPSMEKDTARLDLDESDGRPRFYGPTSNAHIHRAGVPVEDEDSVVDNEGPSIDSLPLKALLLNTYWKIQMHSFVVVDETLFMQGRDTGLRCEYYSQFLEDALLASATRMSTSSGVRKLGSRYVDRAKTVLALELERPNTATLQGFLLLSDFEATRGRDRLGYLYCGIGCKLVFDLGLHESCAELVAKGKLSAQEAMWRHTLFLGSFAYDTLWSLYTGRPGSISISILETAHSKALGSGWSGPATLDPWTRLCTDISEATDILNTTTSFNRAARERVISLDHRIHGRLQSLPLSLCRHEDRASELPPPAYSLHIQFHGFRIILHRLLYKSVDTHSAQASGDGDHRRYSIERSRAIMYENAIQISQLMAGYQQIFGIEQVITIMLDNSYVACVVLISHVLRAMQHDQISNSIEKDVGRLRTLAELLLQAQKHYPVTVRMRFSLASHVENTPMAGMFGIFPQKSQEVEPTSTTATEPIDSTKQQPLLPTSNEFVLEEAALRPDWTLFPDWEANNGTGIYQEMDMQNLMSWALSPPSTRHDVAFQ